MSSIYASIVNETIKIFYRKKLIAFSAISIIIPVLSALLIRSIQTNAEFFTIASSDLPIMMLGIFTNALIPLFIFSLAADMFSGEYGENTMKLTLTRPVSRIKVYTSKIAALSLFIALTLTLTFLASYISGLFAGNNGDAVVGFLNSLKAYAIAFIPMVAITTSAAFISMFFRSSGAALTAGVFVYIISKLVGILSSKTSSFLLFSYTDWHMLWLGSSLDWARLFVVFTFMLGYSIILFTAGYIMFENKDL